MKKIENWIKYSIIVGTCLTLSNCEPQAPEGMRPVSIRRDGISDYIFYNSIFGNGYVPIEKEK